MYSSSSSSSSSFTEHDQATQEIKKKTDLNPLAIPELVDLIVSFLDTRSLSFCVRVNHEWNQTFHPHLWSDIRTHRRTYPHTLLPLVPSFDNLIKYATEVKKLVLAEDLTFSPYLLQGAETSTSEKIKLMMFPKLLDLSLVQEIKDPLLLSRPFSSHPPLSDASEDNTIMTLVSNHRTTLKALCYTNIRTKTSLDPAIECPNLASLAIGYLNLRSPQEWIDCTNLLFARLQRLELHGPLFQRKQLPKLSSSSSSFPSTDAVTPAIRNTATTRIQDLTVHIESYTTDGPKAIQQLILNSPKLTHLTWRVSPHSSSSALDSRPFFLLAETVAQTLGREEGAVVAGEEDGARGAVECCRFLKSLDLSGNEFDDKDLELVLESTPFLTDLSLGSNNSFHSSTWKIFKDRLPRYLTTLRVLRLQGSQKVNGEMIVDMLCSIQSLEVFKSNFVLASDLWQDTRAWACTGLRELSLVFFVSEEVTEYWHKDVNLEDHFMIFSQLSRLVQLEYLNLGLNREQYRRLRIPRSCRYLQLDLAHGLEALRPLKRLRTIRGLNTPFLAPSDDKSLAWITRKTLWGTDEARWILEHWTRLKRIEGFSFLEGEEVQELLETYIATVHLKCIKRDQYR